MLLGSLQADVERLAPRWEELRLGKADENAFNGLCHVEGVYPRAHAHILDVGRCQRSGNLIVVALIAWDNGKHDNADGGWCVRERCSAVPLSLTEIYRHSSYWALGSVVRFEQLRLKSGHMRWCSLVEGDCTFGNCSSMYTEVHEASRRAAVARGNLRRDSSRGDVWPPPIGHGTTITLRGPAVDWLDEVSVQLLGLLLPTCLVDIILIC